ncbi:hypothetical protein QFZ42_004455 [Variovorax paradoxus]|nr:hypothetical protein [Variovorax paradoxus]
MNSGIDYLTRTSAATRKLFEGVESYLDPLRKGVKGAVFVSEGATPPHPAPATAHGLKKTQNNWSSRSRLGRSSSQNSLLWPLYAEGSRLGHDGSKPCIEIYRYLWRYLFSSSPKNPISMRIFDMPAIPVERACVDRGRPHRHEEGLRRFGCHGPDDARGQSVLRPCLPRQARRHPKGAVVRRPATDAAGQAPRAQPLRLAAGQVRQRLAHAGPTLDCCWKASTGVCRCGFDPARARNFDSPDAVWRIGQARKNERICCKF